MTHKTNYAPGTLVSLRAPPIRHDDIGLFGLSDPIIDHHSMRTARTFGMRSKDVGIVIATSHICMELLLVVDGLLGWVPAEHVVVLVSVKQTKFLGL